MSALPTPLRQAVEATPEDRNRVVDLLRAVAMIAVAVGHWLVMDVRLSPDGALTGDNALTAMPEAHLLTWVFQVMPLFFFVGGFANARSLRSAGRRRQPVTAWVATRMVRLLRPTVVLVAVWTAVTLVTAAFGDGGPAGEGLRQAAHLVAVPLWFLAVYALAVVAAPLMLRLHDRHGWRVLAVMVGGSMIVDAAVAEGVPLVGWLAFPLVWLAPQQAGFAWADGSMPTDRRTPWLVAGAGAAALVALTIAGPYPVAMIGVPGAGRTNTSPPTLALLALAAVQIGVVLGVRDRLEAWLRRPLVWGLVVAANLRAMTIYLWHLTAALLVAVATIPTGLLPTPAVGTATWWQTRITWIVLSSVVLAVLVSLFGRFEQGKPPAPVPPRGWYGLLGAVASVVLALATAVTSGLGGSLGPVPVGPAVLAVLLVAWARLAGRPWVGRRR